MTGIFCISAIPLASSMPLNEIPKYFSPEIRHLVDAALEDAWQEVKKERPGDALPAKMQLAKTIVALVSVGETDPDKLKSFALHAIRAALRTSGPRRRGPVSRDL
jgi:hypothetical protein